jgi:hypothetical protein
MSLLEPNVFRAYQKPKLEQRVVAVRNSITNVLNHDLAGFWQGLDLTHLLFEIRSTVLPLEGRRRLRGVIRVRTPSQCSAVSLMGCDSVVREAGEVKVIDSFTGAISMHSIKDQHLNGL